MANCDNMANHGTESEIHNLYQSKVDVMKIPDRFGKIKLKTMDRTRAIIEMKKTKVVLLSTLAKKEIRTEKASKGKRLTR